MNSCWMVLQWLYISLLDPLLVIDNGLGMAVMCLAGHFVIVDSHGTCDFFPAGSMLGCCGGCNGAISGEVSGMYVVSGMAVSVALMLNYKAVGWGLWV